MNIITAAWILAIIIAGAVGITSLSGVSNIDVVTDFRSASPPSKTMQVLVDFQSIPKWNPMVLKVTNHFSGEVKEGVRFSELRKILGKVSEADFVVTKLSADECIVNGKSYYKNIDFRFSIVPDSSGTKVRLNFTEGPVNGALAVILRPFYRRAITKNMEQLRALIDNSKT